MIPECLNKGQLIKIQKEMAIITQSYMIGEIQKGSRENPSYPLYSFYCLNINRNEVLHYHISFDEEGKVYYLNEELVR